MESLVCPDQCQKDDLKKEAMTESTAVALGAAALERSGSFGFPASRVRGKHPDSFTPKEIAEMTDDELKDYIIGLKILDASRFVLELIPDVA